MQASLTFLSSSELEQIHLATLEVLEKTGVVVEAPAVVAHLVRQGAQAAGNRLRIPRQMVTEALAMANREVTFAAVDPKYDFLLPKKKYTYNATSGYSPFIYDQPGGKRRQSRGEDLAKIARLCDDLAEIDFFWPIVMPTEESSAEMEELSAYNIAVRHTGKHIECSCASEGAARYQVQIAETLAGGSQALRKRPLLSVVASPTTPLAFEKGTAEALAIMAKAGVPVTPMNVPLAGTTAPASFAGTLVITNAEQLAALVILKAYNPEAPMIYAADTGSADLRTGDVAYANPDYDLFSIGCAQLAKSYALPSCVAHGSSEVREFDRISGFERNVLKIAISQMTYTDTSVWIGSQDDSLSTSLWDIVLDVEALAAAKLYCKSLDVSAESLAVSVIDEIGPRGEFISSDHTFRNFKREICTVSLPESYLFQGEGTYLEKAMAKAAGILAQPAKQRLSAECLAELDDIMATARREFYR